MSRHQYGTRTTHRSPTVNACHPYPPASYPAAASAYKPCTTNIPVYAGRPAGDIYSTHRAPHRAELPRNVAEDISFDDATQSLLRWSMVAPVSAGSSMYALNARRVESLW
jgi:hypothetical protein